MNIFVLWLDNTLIRSRNTRQYQTSKLVIEDQHFVIFSESYISYIDFIDFYILGRLRSNYLLLYFINRPANFDWLIKVFVSWFVKNWQPNQWQQLLSDFINNDMKNNKILYWIKQSFCTRTYKKNIYSRTL